MIMLFEGDNRHVFQNLFYYSKKKEDFLKVKIGFWSGKEII